MKTSPPAARVRHSCTALFATAVATSAQIVPPAPVEKPVGVAPVQLSVFEVTADKDLGYAASTAMSGTRTNEKLEHLPNAISVLNQDFLQDVAGNNFFDAVEFAVGAENIFNDSGTRGAAVGARSGSQISFRGLPSFRQLRDGFPWYVPQDLFSTERIEIARGPGGLAYGDVDAGGIINISSKRANLAEPKNAVQVRIDDFGTRRGSIDFNRPVLANRLAVRLNAVASATEGWRQRSGDDTTAVAAGVRWEPFKDHRTRLDVNFEDGRLTNYLSHAALNDHVSAYVRGTGTTAIDANPNVAGNQNNGVGMARIAGPGNTHAFGSIGQALYNFQTLSATSPVFRSSLVVNGAGATAATDPQNPIRIPLGPIAESIVPRGQDWAGPDSNATSDWRTLTLELQHRFNERWDVLLACNRQEDRTLNQTMNNGATFGDNARSIHIDVNPVLPNPTGTGTIPNPRFEEHFIARIPVLRTTAHRIESIRVVSVHGIRLPWGIEQRLIGTAGYRHERYDRDLYGYALTPAEIARRGFTGDAALFTNNKVTPILYLRDGNGDAALRFTPLPGVAEWYRDGADNQRFNQNLTSASFNALGSYVGGRLRTSLGLSRDRWRQDASLPVVRGGPNGEMTFVDLAGNLLPAGAAVPTARLTKNHVTNQTYGGVFHLTRWLSLTATYQESALFTDNLGTDLTGRPRPPTAGEGHDFGLRFSLLENAVVASLIHYDNKAENIRSAITNAVRTELNILLVNDPVIGTDDSVDRATQGVELEVVANLRRNWTLRMGVATSKVDEVNLNPLTRAALARARATATARGLEPDAATVATRDFLTANETTAGGVRRGTGNLTTRYTLEKGALRGFAFGGSIRYAEGRPQPRVVITGQEVVAARTTNDQWTVSPFASYRRKFGRLTWSTQVNVNNVFDEVTDQGTVYRYPRYTDPRQIVFTNTLTF